MKKILAVCSVLLASTSLAMAEHRSDPNMMDNWDMSNFYAGGDLGFTKLDYSATLDAAAEDTMPMLNVYMGYNIDEYYAIEWGAFMTTQEDRTVGATKTDAEEFGTYVDVVGKYALKYDFTALGTVGLQYSKFKAKGGSIDISESEFAPRLGAGLEYNVSDTMKVRGMARYVFSDYDGAVDNAIQYTIGMNYTF